MNKIAFLISLCLLAVSFTPQAVTRAAQKPQVVTVKITKQGFEPKTFTLQRDVPARVTFVRETDQTCGHQLVLSEYNINRALPLAKPITVEFTPRRAGEFTVTCGMNMLRGKVVVQ